MSKQHNNVHKKVKVKALYLTPAVPSVTMLVPMKADGAPFTPLLHQCPALWVLKLWLHGSEESQSRR